MNIEPMKAVIGSYADYLDTGIWRVSKDGTLIPPSDLTPRQLQDARWVGIVKETTPIGYCEFCGEVATHLAADGTKVCKPCSQAYRPKVSTKE